MPEIKLDHLKIIGTFLDKGWRCEIYAGGPDAIIHTISPDGSVFRSSLVHFEEDFYYSHKGDDYNDSHTWEDPILLERRAKAEVLYVSLRFHHLNGSLPEQKGITIVNTQEL